MKPAIRQLLLGRRTNSDPVLALFGVNDQGTWLDWSDASSLRQDSAGTTAVTLSGDPIGLAVDKTGRGNHATQATALNRPTWGPTGMVCGGAKTMQTTAFMNNSFSQACTIFCAITSAGTASAGNTVVFGTQTPSFWLGITGTTGAIDFTSSLVGAAVPGPMEATGIATVVAGQNRVGVSVGRWWIQGSGVPKGGSASVSSKSVTGNLSLVGNALTLGGLTSASFLWTGSIGEFICINRDVTTAEYKRVMKYLTAKWAPYSKKLMVCCGNSLTSGQGSTGGPTQALSTTGTNYPSRVLSALTATWDVRTDAYPGRTTNLLLSESVSFADFMTANTGVRKACVVWEGTNMLAQGYSVTDTQNTLAAYCAARKAEGFGVLVGTIIPRQEAGLYAGFNADRLAVNTWLAANFTNFSDGVVDFAAQVELSDPTNVTYFNADKIHLTDAGYQKVADVVTAKITALGW